MILASRGLLGAAEEFLRAADALFDWMNGCDLSADHRDSKPEDFARLCAALPAFRAALAEARTHAD